GLVPPPDGAGLHHPGGRRPRPDRGSGRHPTRPAPLTTPAHRRSHTMTWICDGKSAATLIYDEAGRLLAHTRATAPAGIALGPAGHVDDVHPGATHIDAAVCETEEEYGLTVTPGDLDLVLHRWLPNRCGADIPALPHGGH